MKKYKVILLVVFCFFFSCNKKDNSTLRVSYIRYNNELILKYENNTFDNIVFPVPNTLHFGDVKTKNHVSIPEMGGFPPLTIYAIINPNQFSKFYQKKLDSIYDGYLTEIGNLAFIGDKRPGDGNSVLYLPKNKTLEIRYKLTVKPLPNTSYSSKYKQNYYPYDKILKGQYPEGEYLRRFSKLNFKEAKFLVQPVIEDSLFLRLSEKDSNY